LQSSPGRCPRPRRWPGHARADQPRHRRSSESNRQLASKAIEVSEARPSPWDVGDAALELGIGICAILGGVYGTKAAKFLEEAKTKSKALKEIITGNELFKKANQTQADAFKQAHANQSPETRQIVTEMKHT